MLAVTRKDVVKVVALLLCAALFGFSFVGATYSSPLRSVELGIAEISPAGVLGGKVIPASCPSYEHAPGGCAPNPTCSGAGPDNAALALDATTHTMTAAGVTNASRVYFATWSEVNGQDDIVWYQGTQVMTGGTFFGTFLPNLGTPTDQWTTTINPQSHPGEGTVHVHVYMYGTNGSVNIWCDTANFFKGNPPPPTAQEPDVCPNLPGTQTEVPIGHSVDASGNCIADTGVCPAGQTGTPPNCVDEEETCPAGTTGTPPDCVPDDPGQCPTGYVLSPSGSCIQGNGSGDPGGNGGGGGGTGSDVCVNLPGTQTNTPSGYVWDASNTCTPSVCTANPAQCDFCPNLSGLQGTAGDIPSGYVVNSGGYCVPFGGEACDLSAADLIIGQGESTTLNFSCGSSATASGLNFSTGGSAVGTATVSPEDTTDYWLQCQAGCQDLVTVEVAKFSLDITGSPTRVRAGQPATITWTATGVQSCTVSGPDGFSASGMTGSKQTGPIESASTYTLTCQTVLGPRTDTFRVTVLPGTDEF